MEKLTRRNFLKLSTTGGASAAILALLGGCSDKKESTDSGNKTNANSSTGSDDGKLNIVCGVGEDFVDLTPYTSTGCSILVKPAIYETMCELKSMGGEMQYNLAKNVTRIDDLTADIELYDYITDSEGTNITADDVVKCYTWAKESGLVNKMSNMESIEAIDAYTVRYHFSNNYIGVFEDQLKKVKIVSYDKFEASGDNMALEAIATGAYVVDDYTTGSFITLKKREDYWQTDESLIPDMHKANVDSVTYKVIGSTSQMAIAMENGEVDMIPYFAGSDAAKFFNGDQPIEGYDGMAYLEANILHLWVNMHEDSILFNHKEIRQAMFYAIDAQGCLEGAGDGLGEVCHTYGSRVYGDYIEDWTNEEYWPYDPDKAKELIEGSDFDMSQPIKLMAANTSPMKDLATLIQGYLLAVGFNIEMCIYDNALVTDYSNDPAQWDLMISRLLSPDVLPNLWSYVFIGKTYVTMNFAQYDTELQEILELCRNEATHTEENLRKMHQHLIDEAYVYGIYNAWMFTVTKPGVEKFYLSPNLYPIPTAHTYSASFGK